MLINAWLSGAIFMAATVIALFFLRYWRQTREKLFVYFALAFILEGILRLLQAWPSDLGDSPYTYFLRLLEYGLIVYAVVQKNRGSVPDK